MLDRCHFVVVSRPGPVRRRRCVTRCRSWPAGWSTRRAVALRLDPRIVLVDAPTAPVSSTEVRRARPAGERYRRAGAAPAVAAYIERHGLYRRTLRSTDAEDCMKTTAAHAESAPPNPDYLRGTDAGIAAALDKKAEQTSSCST